MLASILAGSTEVATCASASMPGTSTRSANGSLRSVSPSTGATARVLKSCMRASITEEVRRASPNTRLTTAANTRKPITPMSMPNS